MAGYQGFNRDHGIFQGGTDPHSIEGHAEVGQGLQGVVSNGGAPPVTVKGDKGLAVPEDDISRTLNPAQPGTEEWKQRGSPRITSTGEPIAEAVKMVQGAPVTAMGERPTTIYDTQLVRGTNEVDPKEHRALELKKQKELRGTRPGGEISMSADVSAERQLRGDTHVGTISNKQYGINVPVSYDSNGNPTGNTEKGLADAKVQMQDIDTADQRVIKSGNNNYVKPEKVKR